MSKKQIKTEVWTVDELIQKILNKSIFKPKFQRKKKWQNKPSEKKIRK